MSGVGDASVVTWLVASALVVTARLALHGAQRATATRAGGRPTLIVGAGEVGHRIARRLDDDRSLGLTPIGFLDKEPLGSASTATSRCPSSARAGTSSEIVARHGVQHGRVRVLDRAERA